VSIGVADKILYVKDAAARASNRKGGFGVTGKYIRDEINRGNLKATYRTPPIGLPYWEITEEDFLAWEEKRGRSPGDEP
jgi:hypothetical protein